MKYEKAQAKIVMFEMETFMTGSSDTPVGNFTCGEYKQGQSCENIAFAVGYTCGVYTNGNCTQVYSPPGSMGDGCYSWKLNCSKF